MLAMQQAAVCDHRVLQDPIRPLLDVKDLPAFSSDPNERKPANKDADLFIDQVSFRGGESAADRSSRVRKQVHAYTDTGSATRKPSAKLDDDDCMDAITGIMASSSGALQQPAERSNEEKHPEMTRRKKMRKRIQDGRQRSNAASQRSRAGSSFSHGRRVALDQILAGQEGDGIPRLRHCTVRRLLKDARV